MVHKGSLSSLNSKHQFISSYLNIAKFIFKYELKITISIVASIARVRQRCKLKTEYA